MNSWETIGRAGVLVAASSLAWIDVPTLVLAPVGALALGMSAELVSRGGPERGGPERILVGTGFLLIAGVLGGLLLNFLPGGISTPGWAVYWLALGLAVLLVRHDTPPARIRRHPGPARGGIPVVAGYAAAGALFIGATVGAVVFDREPADPPLELWLVERRAGAVVVAIRTSQTADGITARITDEAGGGIYWSTPPFDVTGHEVRTVEAPLPGTGRWRISVAMSGTGRQTQELVVDAVGIPG